MEQQTAVELLHKKSNELITQYLDNKITKRDLITMHHNILYPHKAMEKEQIMNAFLEGKINHDKDWAIEYYNKTYTK
jgi:hypothetical protein